MEEGFYSRKVSKKSSSVVTYLVHLHIHAYLYKYGVDMDWIWIGDAFISHVGINSYRLTKRSVLITGRKS